MAKYLFLVLFLVTYNTSIAQITWDTARDLSRHEGGYGKFRPSVKAAVFYNNYIGFEIARVKNNLSLVWMGSNTATKYYGIQWINNHNYKYGLWGFKAGGEADFRYLHFGCSLLAQTNFEQLKYYLAPGVGLSWRGTVGIYYDFIIPLSKKEFTGSNDYQIGIKYNFTKDLREEFRGGL